MATKKKHEKIEKVLKIIGILFLSVYLLISLGAGASYFKTIGLCDKQSETNYVAFEDEIYSVVCHYTPENNLIVDRPIIRSIIAPVNLISGNKCASAIFKEEYIENYFCTVVPFWYNTGEAN